MATFATYSFINIGTDNRLTPDKAFVALSLFDLLSFPIAIAPTLILLLIQVSFGNES